MQQIGLELVNNKMYTDRHDNNGFPSAPQGLSCADGAISITVVEFSGFETTDGVMLFINAAIVFLHNVLQNSSNSILEQCIDLLMRLALLILA
eukprot:8130169-Ditylum_brightwellii.AAC.1